MRNLSRYKIVNLALLTLSICLYLFVEFYLDTLCANSPCLYDYQYTYYDPLSAGSFIMIVILAFLILVPADLFRKWLWYIFPVSLVATIYFVSQVSVYSSGILSTTRGAAAELSMQFFAIATLLFVLGHLSYGYIKQRRNKSKT